MNNGSSDDFFRSMLQQAAGATCPPTHSSKSQAYDPPDSDAGTMSSGSGCESDSASGASLSDDSERAGRSSGSATKRLRVPRREKTIRRSRPDVKNEEEQLPLDYIIRKLGYYIDQLTIERHHYASSSSSVVSNTNVGSSSTDHTVNNPSGSSASISSSASVSGSRVSSVAAPPVGWPN